MRTNLKGVFGSIADNRKGLHAAINRIMEYFLTAEQGTVPVKAVEEICGFLDIPEIESYVMDTFAPDMFHVYADLIKLKLLIDLSLLSSDVAPEDLSKTYLHASEIFNEAAIPIQYSLFPRTPILFGGLFPQDVWSAVLTAWKGDASANRAAISSVLISHLTRSCLPEQSGFLENPEAKNAMGEVWKTLTESQTLEDVLQTMTIDVPGGSAFLPYDILEADSMPVPAKHMSGLKHAVRFLLPEIFVSALAAEILFPDSVAAILKTMEK